MRPIDGDALENALSKVKDFAPELCGRPIIRVTDMIDIIRNMPTVDVMPVRHGRWVDKKFGDAVEIMHTQEAKCSICGEYLTTPYIYYWDNHNFCPNCGADMRKIEKND